MYTTKDNISMVSLTVADILQLHIFRTASVLTGSRGLSNTVTGITTADDPDLVHWLRGGEMLIISLRDYDQHAFSNQHYLDELSQKQISALIIKTTKPDEKLPDSLIESGSSLSIPVIGLSPDVRFIDVISSVMNEIQKNKNKYYTDIQNDMTHRLASGANEQDLLDMLARYIPVHVTFSKTDQSLTLSSQSEGFDPSSAIADRIRLPIMSMGEVSGYLEAVSNRFFDENLEQLLKAAANLLAILSLKKYYIAEIEQKYIAAFLNDLFKGTMTSKQLEERALGYGLHKDDSFLIVLIDLESQNMAGNLQEALMDLAHKLPKNGYYFMIHDTHMHIMFHSSKEISAAGIQADISKTMTELEQIINRRYHGISFYAGISELTCDISQVPLKIQEARDALQFGHAFHNNIVKYKDLGVLRILAAYSHSENFEQIIPPAVQKLANYDKANNTQYLETLDSLLGNNLNLSKTAKQLFIHYKTMLHRMNRICEIAEISLDDRQTRLDMELGIKLYMMLPK